MDVVGVRRTSPLDERVLGALLVAGRATADELAARLVTHRMGVIDSLERLRKRSLVRRAATQPGRRAWGQVGAPGLWELADAEERQGVRGAAAPGIPS